MVGSLQTLLLSVSSTHTLSMYIFLVWGSMLDVFEDVRAIMLDLKSSLVAFEIVESLGSLISRDQLLV